MKEDVNKCRGEARALIYSGCNLLMSSGVVMSLQSAVNMSSAGCILVY